MEEVWKDIKNYEGLYQVSNLGRVRSVERTITYKDGRVYKYKSKLLAYNISKRNYDCKYVHLYIESSRKAFSVHRLVAAAFLDNPENYPEVNHINGKREDNSVSNLEWCTRAYNMKHAFREGLINNTGVNHGNNRYTNEQIIKVKTLLKEGKLTNKEIEAATGVKSATVIQIKKGRQWKHIKV